MSTHAYILIQNEDNSIDGIYLHCDGMPAHCGQLLVNYYGTTEKVKELIKLGGLSVLGESIGVKCDFDNNRLPHQCIAYHRDRGENLEIIHEENLPTALRKMDTVPYIYVFKTDITQWMYTRGGDMELYWLNEKLHREKKQKDIEARACNDGRIHAHWTEKRTGQGVFDYQFQCSHCFDCTPDKAYAIAPDFCPHCGAVMDEKKE